MILLALVLGSCATAYQPSALTGGFDQTQLREDVWRVTFGGNGFTSLETAQTYWLYRVAELTLEKGFDGFEILSDIELVKSISPEAFFETGRPVLQTAGTSVYIPPRKPRIEADIRLLKKPFETNPPRVFDAKELKSALEPHVKGGKCSIGNVCPHPHEYLRPRKGNSGRPTT